MPDPQTMPGLKDHEIAKLVNAVRDELNARITGLPQCLRELILGAVLKSLEDQGRRIDAKV